MWLRTTFFKTIGNLLYLKGEYQILVYDFDGKTKVRKLIHTEIGCLDLLHCKRVMSLPMEDEVGYLISFPLK